MGEPASGGPPGQHEQAPHVPVLVELAGVSGGVRQQPGLRLVGDVTADDQASGVVV